MQSMKKVHTERQRKSATLPVRIHTFLRCVALRLAPLIKHTSPSLQHLSQAERNKPERHDAPNASSPHGHNITLVSPPYTVHARKMIEGNTYIGLTVPDGFRSTRRYSARTGKTEFIVDERGHLVKGMKRPHTAFVRPTTFHTNERWPVMSTFVSGGSSHTLVGVGSSATMGYKGIPSTYLPMGSVPIRTTSTCPGGFKPAHSHFFV